MEEDSERPYIAPPEDRSDPPAIAASARAIERRVGRYVLGALAAVLTALLVAGATGVTERVAALIFGEAQAAQPKAAEDTEVQVREIRRALDAHVAESSGLVTIWREDRTEVRAYRDRTEARLSAMERKLDRILDRLDRRAAVAPLSRPSALALAAAPKE